MFCERGRGMEGGSFFKWKNDRKEQFPREFPCNWIYLKWLIHQRTMR